MRNQLIAGAVLLLTLGGVIAAQTVVIRRDDSGQETARFRVNLATSWHPSGAAGVTQVMGSVIDVRKLPVAWASLQLRNLDTGTVEQRAESTDSGNFVFDLAPGTYVVEMMHPDGHVMALSAAGAVSQNQVMHTVVQIPGIWDAASRRLSVPQHFPDFFGLSAQDSMTAGAIDLAVTSNVRPANPGIPVSP